MAISIEKHYNTLAPKITNFLVGNGMEYQTACDIVQETFMRIWKMKDSVKDDPEQVSGLAFTIARNLRASYYRDNARMTYIPEVRDEDDTRGAAGPAALPSDSEYLRSRIKEALGKLPPMLREAYTLFQISELPVKKIAEQLGISENLVKVRVHRAKKLLQPMLKDLL